MMKSSLRAHAVFDTPFLYSQENTFAERVCFISMQISGLSKLNVKNKLKDRGCKNPPILILNLQRYKNVLILDNSLMPAIITW